MNFEENTVRYAQISAALSRSRFRSRFRLGLKDRQYICDRGWETMRRHAAELVEERLPRARLYPERRQTDAHARLSGLYRAARDRLLLPRLSGKMA